MDERDGVALSLQALISAAKTSLADALNDATPVRARGTVPF